MNFFPQITLALLLTAWFTSKRNTIKGQGFFKVVFYMPNIITAASVAILFNVLFGYPKGPVNDILVSLGLRSEAFFFTNSATASRWIIAFIQFWMWYGYTMIILISGVLGINPEIYEAAEIDGANDWQTFWQITIPNLRTILTYTLSISRNCRRCWQRPILLKRNATISGSAVIPRTVPCSASPSPLSGII